MNTRTIFEGEFSVVNIQRTCGCGEPSPKRLDGSFCCVLQDSEQNPTQLTPRTPSGPHHQSTARDLQKICAALGEVPTHSSSSRLRSRSCARLDAYNNIGLVIVFSLGVVGMSIKKNAQDTEANEFLCQWQEKVQYEVGGSMNEVDEHFTATADHRTTPA